MTEKEKRTILDMRAAGKQYKEISGLLGIEVSALKVFVHRQRKPDARKCAMCGKRLPEKARASQRFCSINAKTHGGKSIPTRAEMTSGLFAPAHPAAGSSFPTTRIQNTVPEIAIMRLSEKREQQHPGGVMPLFSLPESPRLEEEQPIKKRQTQ